MKYKRGYSREDGKGDKKEGEKEYKKEDEKEYKKEDEKEDRRAERKDGWSRRGKRPASFMIWVCLRSGSRRRSGSAWRQWRNGLAGRLFWGNVLKNQNEGRIFSMPLPVNEPRIREYNPVFDT